MTEFEPEVLTKRDHATGEIFVRAGEVSALYTGAGDSFTVVVGNEVLNLHAVDLQRLRAVLGELSPATAPARETSSDYVRERGCWGDHRVQLAVG